MKNLYIYIYIHISILLSLGELSPEDIWKSLEIFTDVTNEGVGGEVVTPHWKGQECC